MLCFPLALIDCLQQEKHRLSPLTGTLLSDVIITPMLSKVILLYSSRKRAFILITLGLFNKMKRFFFFFATLHACPLLKWSKPVVICAAPRQLCAVHSVYVPSSWVKNKKKKKPSLPSPNFCVRTTNDHKSAAFTVFCGPTLSSGQNETKEWRDDEVPSSAGQVFPLSPGSRGVHLPTTNPL